MSEVLPGLWRMPIRVAGFPFTTAYLIADGEHVLVDTGLPKRARAVEAAIRRAGRRPQDVGHILITHYHVDHIGSLAAVAGSTKARTYVHPSDAAVVREGR